MTDVEKSLIMISAASAMNAGFTLPMKVMRAWSWQTAWLLWSVCALIILPAVVAVSTVPHLASIYAKAGASSLCFTMLFGVGWGVAQVLFGLAIARIGIALSFALVLGTSACVGGLLPLLTLSKVRTPSASLLLYGAAMLIMMCGVALCAYAGKMRERTQAGLVTARITVNSIDRRSSGEMTGGLWFGISGGICASCMSLGLTWAAPILEIARATGTQPRWLTNAVWLPLLAAGAIPNLAYCVYLHIRERTKSEYVQSGSARNVVLAMMMAVLWFSSSLLYGVAILRMGTLGGVLGWPAFMSLIIISAGAFGILSGDWRGVRVSSITWQCVGVLLLCSSIFLLSRVPV